MGAQATLGAASVPDTSGLERDQGGRAPRVGLVRLAWLAAAAAAAALIAVGLPGYLERLAAVCRTAPCAPGQLTPDRLRALEAAGLSAGQHAAWLALVNVAAAAVFAAVGGLLVWRRPGERMARFSAFALLLFAGPLTFVQVAGPVHPALWWPAAVFDSVGAAAFTALLFVFPDGRFVPRWTRWVAAVWIAVQVPAPFLPSGSGQAGAALQAVSSPVFVVGLLTAASAQVHRYRRVSTPAQRQQTKWTAFGFATGLGLFAVAGVALLAVPADEQPVAALWLTTAAYAGATLLPASVAVALLRHRLYDVDALIGRTLVYAALTVCTVAVYVLVVGYLGALFRAGDSLPVSLLAAGAVAVLFQPLRGRLQRGVNRLLYGQRDEPYAVLTTVGRQLGGPGGPDAMLPAAAETIARALKLPYVAIRAAQAEGATAEVAAVGAPAPAEEPVRLPLLHQGDAVGELLLGRRGRGEPFGPADRRLLEDLARQAAAAVHAWRLTAELRRARAWLVRAREEERRRLRRDLHDGLGPTLAALGLKLETARNLLGQDPRADALLGDLAERAQAAVGDIRRLVYALRPPALDERGLVGALRQAAAGFETQAPGALRVTLDVPDPLPALPAAVEVAAYRIAQEALTNVVRHAGAGACALRLAVDPATATLRLTIEDDGVGLPAGRPGCPEGRPAGVGLASMRERAEELGGGLAVEPRPGGGTRVAAVLPLPGGEDGAPGAGSAPAGAPAEAQAAVPAGRTA
jgi:signal transduction histidine kinase